MPKYKIIQSENDDVRMEKTDFKVDFTTKDVKEYYANLKKALVECEAKIKLEQATQTNILENHTEVEKLTDEIKQATYLWVKSKLEAIPAEEQSNAIIKALEAYDKELADIKEQTNIDILGE